VGNGLACEKHILKDRPTHLEPLRQRLDQYLMAGIRLIAGCD